jgi:anaerobic sulfite reductase subunit C
MFKDFGVHMKGGVITERDTQYCTVRIRLPAGIFSVEQMRGIATLAKRYGKGFVHCTARQTVEIPHVDPKKLRALEKALIKNGTPIGSERDEIVNVIACPGTERCKFANIDTASLAKKIDQKLFGKIMPVKCVLQYQAARMPVQVLCLMRLVDGCAPCALKVSARAVEPVLNTVRKMQ